MFILGASEGWINIIPLVVPIVLHMIITKYGDKNHSVTINREKED